MPDLSWFSTYAKQLVRLGVHKAGGGRLAAAYTSIAESELSRYGSEADSEKNRNIPFYMWLALDEAAGDAGLKEEARRRGYALVALDRDNENTECVSKLAGKAAVAQAALVQTVLDAAADGHVDAQERRDAFKKKIAVIDTTEDLVDALEGLATSRRSRAGGAA